MAFAPRIAASRRQTESDEQPLLRSPFPHAGLSALSELAAGWGAPALDPARRERIKEMVIGGAIGGAFWRAAQNLPSGRKDIVVLPHSLSAARDLWVASLARSHAESLAVCYPPGPHLKPLLTEIAAAGVHLAAIGNPHGVLDIATTVLAAGPGDLTSLAALAGIQAFQFRQGEFQPIAPDSVFDRITEGTHYTNPYTGQPARIEEIADILGDWRRMFARNRGIAACTSVAFWKRRRIAQLLHNGESSPRFFRSAKAGLNHAARQNGAVAAWITTCPATLPEQADAKKIPFLRLEDGFIRSAGLGSGLLPPASIVADGQGIYFDPGQPSDLETLLQTTAFPEALLARARRLIHLLAAKHIAKYGSAGPSPALDADPARRIILVPGQVADDRSLQLGTSGTIRDNLSMLREVRRRNADAYIVYRPHPDVLAGHRIGSIPNPVSLGFADQLVGGGSIAKLIGMVDEVHTMTSLAGFEALLRGRIVHTYGQPFYAGWGLTTDHLPIERRQRRLRIEELVAGALILYPHYFDPVTRLPCGPEILIARLQQPELWRPGPLMRLRHLQGTARRVMTGWAERWIRTDA